MQDARDNPTGALRGMQDANVPVTHHVLYFPANFIEEERPCFTIRHLLLSVRARWARR